MYHKAWEPDIGTNLALCNQEAEIRFGQNDHT